MSENEKFPGHCGPHCECVTIDGGVGSCCSEMPMVTRAESANWDALLGEDVEPMARLIAWEPLPVGVVPHG